MLGNFFAYDIWRKKQVCLENLPKVNLLNLVYKNLKKTKYMTFSGNKKIKIFSVLLLFQTPFGKQ